MKNIKEEIYRIIDSFLVEAKDQKGNERSLEQLDQDRHLAAQALEELFQSYISEKMPDSLDAMVRDFTRAFPRPKSEVRRRIQEYCHDFIKE